MRIAKCLAAAVAIVLLLPAVSLASSHAPTPWPGGVWQPGPQTYGDTTVQSVPITMSDGVVLVGDVEYPTDPATGQRAEGRFPVLLTQNPYSCDTPVNNANSFFVSRGYIFATVCVRGTGRSGGEFTFFGAGQEASDGVELVHWASRLEGSNGEVGLTGCSYLGMNQLFTAGRLGRHSPVKEIAPFCAGSETYREGWMGQGMPTETANILPIFGGLVGPRGGAWGQAAYNEILAGGPAAYAGDFWYEKAPGDFAPTIVRNRIPALLWSGWNDMFTETSEEMYAYLQNAWSGRPVHAPMRPGQRVTGRYQIVVGPWSHGQGIDQNIQLEWFDTWLKHAPTRMTHTRTPMHLWDLGSGHWINAATYPMTSRYTPFYLGNDAKLTSTPPTDGGSEPIAWAQPGDGSILSYDSPPFRHGATLAGPIGASLYASSSNRNLELIATLSDVDPSGTATKLTSGWVIGSLRARDPSRSWRDDQGLAVLPYCLCDKDRYLTPGQVNRFEFWISPRIASIAPGHSLRLTLTTQTPAATCAAAFIGVDPCTPTAPQRQTLPGTYRVAHGRDAPSAINLPLVPAGFFAPAGTDPSPRDWGQPGHGPPSG